MRAKRNRRIIVLTRVALVAGLITAVKLGFHAMGWEFISINPLFSALVASTVFLLGFLLNGVLSDFKESEKLPGEIASSLMLIARETNDSQPQGQCARVHAGPWRALPCGFEMDQIR